MSFGHFQKIAILDRRPLHQIDAPAKKVFQGVQEAEILDRWILPPQVFELNEKIQVAAGGIKFPARGRAE